MTHDELLDKIYWHWRKDPRGDGLQTISDYRRAILAVVELHAEDYGMCMTCEMKDYPCPTIQTIEKELS